MLRSLNNPSTKFGQGAYAALTVVFVFLFLATLQLNASEEAFEGIAYMEAVSHYADMDQYARLADALIHGSITLDLPVPQELQSLSNPYNTQARIAAGSESIPIYWDHAYFEGKYYSYFGVIPAVLVYMPFQIITGEWLPTPWAIGFIGSLAIIAMGLAVRQIGVRYFDDIATTLSLSVCFFMLFQGSNVIYLAFVSRFYSVPILSSLFLTAIGLWCWMRSLSKSSGEPKSGEQRKATVSKPLIALGSTCMAMNLGCRPQFILAAVLAFPIFQKEIFRERIFFSKKGLSNTLVAVIPFVVVFAPLLAYNYARFGSLFDFGSNYNLTGFDMTQYSQSWKLTARLMLMYLFCPLTFTDVFPYLMPYPTDFLEQAWAPNEPFFGGYFVMKPVLIASLVVFALRKELKSRKLWTFSILCAVFSFVVLFVDTRTAGITERYFSDFGLYVSLMASFAVMVLQSKLKARSVSKRLCCSLLIIAMILTLSLGGLELFSPNRYDSIELYNPSLYESVSSFF